MKFTLLFAMAAVTNAITLQKQGIADESYDTKLDGLENTVSTNHNNERSNRNARNEKQTNEDAWRKCKDLGQGYSC